MCTLHKQIENMIYILMIILNENELMDHKFLVYDFLSFFLLI